MHNLRQAGSTVELLVSQEHQKNRNKFHSQKISSKFKSPTPRAVPSPLPPAPPQLSAPPSGRGEHRAPPLPLRTSFPPPRLLSSRNMAMSAAVAAALPALLSRLASAAVAALSNPRTKTNAFVLTLVRPLCVHRPRSRAVLYSTVLYSLKGSGESNSKECCDAQKNESASSNLLTLRSIQKSMDQF